MKKTFKLLLSLLIIFTMTTLASCSTSTTSKKSTNTDSDMLVHYINVGQGDAELIQVNGLNMLIDAGPGSNQKDLISYLDKLKIKKLDYVIATHPHEDHIGNMDDVINKYEIGKFYAPKVEHTTKAFEKMVTALKKKNLKINVIKEGTDSIDLGKNTKVSVFSPKANFNDKKDLNNYSPIMKIQYGDTSFLFTGDAEKLEENYVLDKGYDVKADVLKLGHHGSTTSTTEKFLKKVNPSIGVISCAPNNDYGHPHKETLKKLEKYKVKVYRTDKDGTITLCSNGKTITKE
ncbi:beta-lactamase domain-containing protein [Clostridium baratii]|uniref:ComEC/Rec2 family competence protein n=1 Tax=Clostridium baratii TaxID=1561 RepID=UPI0006C13AF4|nr:ComEC/Rec2 family competence protein [Clostridium baratii]CUP22213.1 beta-lactamase domain-containing protein [Clostridium baratii]